MTRLNYRTRQAIADNALAQSKFSQHGPMLKELAELEQEIAVMARDRQLGRHKEAIESVPKSHLRKQSFITINVKPRRNSRATDSIVYDVPIKGEMIYGIGTQPITTTKNTKLGRLVYAARKQRSRYYDESKEFRDLISTILHRHKTVAQLLKAWPEAEKYLPVPINVAAEVDRKTQSEETVAKVVKVNAILGNYKKKGGAK